MSSDAYPAEAAGAAARDDDALNEMFDQWDKECEEHWGAWRKEAIEAYRFRDGDQWSDEEKSEAEQARRLVISINRIGAMVNAVCGSEIVGRQQVQYIPRSLEDGGVNQLLTEGADWIRDQANADREDSEAFRDCVTCGLGYTETVMSYEDDPQGQCLVNRIDPLEMAPDPSATKPNLTDARYLRRRRKMALSEYRQLYPTGPTSRDEEIDTARRSGGSRRRAYRSDQPAEECGPNEVVLTEYQWFDFEIAHLVEDPESGALTPLTAGQHAALQAAYEAQGQVLDSVSQRRKRYWRTVRAGRTILEHGRNGDGEFRIKVITGERDRNKRSWYGIVRAMKEPQRFANLFLSLIHHIVRTNAKGGLLAEADAFEDRKQAETTWARPDAITWAAPGAIAGGKLRDKNPPAYPEGLDRLMNIVTAGIRDASGVNEEMLGLVAREQAGVLEHQRKQAAYAILATYFDSLREYRKLQGRLLLKYMQKYLPPNYLVRISGEDGVAKYAPLVKLPETVKFDVVVDEAPQGPNQKERAWALMQPLIPLLQKANVGVEVWAEIIRYSPFPAAVAEKIVAAILKPPAPPDPRKMALMQATAGAQLAERQALAGERQARARKLAAEAAGAEQEQAIQAAAAGLAAQAAGSV